MHPIKFLLETIYELEDAVWRKSKCRLVLISEWNGLIYSESHCCIMNPYKFLRKLICGRKKLFEKFKVGCLVQDHILNLSSMKEAFLSLCFPWRIISSFCSWRHMAQRKMLFEEFQEDYSMDGHLWYLGGLIKANLGLRFALKTSINFMLKRKYRLKDGVWRIPRWLFIILFILRLHVAWCLQSS